MMTEVTPDVEKVEAPVKWTPARILLRVARGLAFIIGSLALFLLGYQSRMIYLPGGYTQDDYIGFPEEGVELAFETSQGRQVAFYLPARNGASDGPLWVVFSGNADVALSWIWFARDYPNASAAFLLVDYPSYGHCEGRPSPKTILESSRAAFTALAAHLGEEEAALGERLHILGYSLGAAAAAQFAAVETPRRLVMLAPFTSMMDMARGMVGWPLCLVLTHRFDNMARLADLARLESPPVVVLIHGTEDSVIPVVMSERLAAAHPGMVQFQSIAGADHGHLLDMGRPQLLQAMQEAMP